MLGSTLLVLTLVFGTTWMFAEFAANDSATRAYLRVTLGFAFVIAIGISTALAELVARRYAGPLSELRRVAKALAEGDFDVRVRSRRRDEIGAIGRAIDEMAEQLNERLRAVHDEETRLRVMLDAMDESVLVTNAKGQIVLSNARFVELAHTDGIGRTTVEAIRNAELHGAVERALIGERVRVVFDIDTSKDVRVISAHAAPLPNRSGAIVVMRDITDVRRLDAVRRDFVANASHELRTPLTAIRGFAETLRDGALDDRNIAERFITNIHDNAIRLSRIVDDLLELSRSESPEVHFELEPIDVEAIASDVIASLESKAHDRSVEVVLEKPQEPMIARADVYAIDHVLINLIDNGIKYTPSGGRVVVRLHQTDAHVIIEITDTGPGIGPLHLPRIFERFYRIDAGRSRDRGGTGLGLSIVKHLTTRMDGEVSVESRVGDGTTFRVQLGRAACETSGRHEAHTHIG